MFGGQLQMTKRTYTFMCTDEAFENLVNAGMNYYGDRQHISAEDSWDIAFGSDVTLAEALEEDRGEVLRNTVALMEALGC
jgi:hypothetical protein